MTSAAPSLAGQPSVERAGVGVRSAAHRWSVAITGAALYCVGLVAQLASGVLVSQPLTEGSSYYVDVARNLVEGRGLVVDAIWSYAIPPLALPRPAFELWQPMASFVAAVPMVLLGASFDAAQMGFAVLGALLAPLAWLVARDAASGLSLPDRRAQAVTLGAGVLTALSAPLLLAGVAPDSTLPFTVAGLAACLLMPRAIGGSRAALLGLGVTLGLAYLTRMEAVWLGLLFVVAAYSATRSITRAVRLGMGAAIPAALVAAPWWLRNVAVFGTPLPGQLTDNAFLTRNEQIFAYLDQPTLAGFLDQGAPTLLANIGAALWHDLVDVLLVPAGPVAALGLITLVVGLRSKTVSRWGSLAFVMGSGALTFAATSVLFPVATLWGTFQHAAGPLHVGLIVCGLIGADAFVARVREWRSWPRANAWLAPAALTLIGLPIAALALMGAATNATDDARRMQQVTQATLQARPLWGGDGGSHTVITDRPIWFSASAGLAAIALPDESVESLTQLARDFHASLVVVTQPRGTMPAALRGDGAQGCFEELPLMPDLPAGSAVFRVREACR